MEKQCVALLKTYAIDSLQKTFYHESNFFHKRYGLKKVTIQAVGCRL